MATTDTGNHRRTFLSFFAKMLMTFIGLLVAIPAVRYFLAPLRRKSGGDASFVDVGSLADIPVGEWRLLTLEMVHEDGWRKSRVRHAIWVRRQPGEGPSAVTVFSTICPHLGCPINWQTDQARFFCPCHGGIFDANGRHAGGPPPRSMDPLDFEVRANRLWVRWRDFKIGVAEQVPVNL